jgi:hypothetical protein
MNIQISRRGNAYLKTAETLLRTARTMTDGSVMAQLEALAENYRRLAAKVSQDDAVKAAKTFERAAASEYPMDPYAGANGLAYR